MSGIVKSKKKLIEEYQKTISSFSKENSLLEEQISDLETTLNLNQNIFYEYMLNTSSSKEETEKIISSIKKLWNENLLLLKKKNTTEIKLSLLKEISEDTPNKIREEIISFKQSNDLMNQEIFKQKEKILKMQKELKNIRKNNLFQEARTENYVICDPTKKIIELSQEISDVKSILNKVSDIHKDKKKTAGEIKDEVEKLKNQVNELMKQVYYIYKKKIKSKAKSVIIIDNNSEKQKKELNDFIKKNIEGYNFKADEEEKSEEEEEEDEDNDEENDEDEIKNINKIKKKKEELSKLTEEYNSLKKQCQEIEKKIVKFKSKYKNYESKINEIKIINDI